MKNKKTVMIILLVFALILGGASVLYNRLGRDMAPEQLSLIHISEPTRPY